MLAMRIDLCRQEGYPNICFNLVLEKYLVIITKVKWVLRHRWDLFALFESKYGKKDYGVVSHHINTEISLIYL
jgi:hypothetical protein